MEPIQISVTMTLSTKEKLAVAYCVKLLRTDFYFHLYAKRLQGHKAEATFNELEEELKDLCGENRYTSYDSFRNQWRRYVSRISQRI